MTGYKDLRTDYNNGIETDSTISSADGNDLEILMSGDHQIYFEAFEMMKEFYADNDKK